MKRTVEQTPKLFLIFLKISVTRRERPNKHQMRNKILFIFLDFLDFCEFS